MVNAFRWMIFVIGLTVVIGSIMVTSAGDLVILSINSPSEGEEVYSKMITVFGTAAATEGRYIVSVTVNNSLAGKETWSDDISLYEGRNTINIVATDNFGNTKTKIRTVDYIAPTHSPTPPSMSPTPPPSQPPRYDGAPSAIPTPTPPPTVSISITTIPSGANVWLDDSYNGTTPIRENVTVGYHKIEVTKEGYDIYSETKKIRWGRGEPQKMIIELKPLTDSIYVFSTPSGASVYLDDVYKRDTNTNCTLSEVVVGPHTITLKKSGYFDETRKVSVPADGPLSLTLRKCSYINISSDPDGAEVYLDGKYTGETTPANISKVALGNHIINLTKFSYFDEERKVDVSVAKTYPVHVNLSGYGYIDIASDPSGAKVYLDGVYKGETPKNISKVALRNHTINLTKFCYDTVIRDVSVSVGETVHLDESLTGYCFLSISSNPSGAKVYLDGDYKGKTLLEDHKVVVGSHSYKLRKTGYETVEKNIELSAGRESVDEPLSGSLWLTLLLPAILTVILALILAVIIEEIFHGYIRNSRFIGSIRSWVKNRR